jgi:hypothetical protein
VLTTESAASTIFLDLIGFPVRVLDEWAWSTGKYRKLGVVNFLAVSVFQQELNL